MGSLERSVELHSLHIASLKELYSAHKITPCDIVNQVYDRVESYHDKAVWIHLVPREDALETATVLAAKYANQPLPPLYGVPFSVKDSIDIAGIPTTVACPSYAYTPDQTAPVVQRVLDAGGILIGKANLDQFATGLVGHRSPYGTPRCVFDSDYISGGSSSGSAISVGSNQVSFAIATDTAGSTRVPATLNGLVGLKPTLGTLSTVGLVPACKTADCITVIARTIEDAREAWQVMKGYDEEDPYARPSLPVLPSFPASIKFGIPPPDLLSILSPAYANLFSQCIDELSSSSMGLQQARVDYAPFQLANDMLYGSSIVAQRLVAFDDYLEDHGLSNLHPVIKTIFELSSGFDAARAYKDIFNLALYKRQAERQFRGNIDILIVPSTVTHFTVAEIEEDPIERNKLMGSFTHFVNLLDLCAVAVPTGKWRNPKGYLMPFGITLIGQAGRDLELMRLGENIVQHMSLHSEVV
ncbi:amidase signature domain-containing protein [Aspergillus cavernicola]|uniref:Amidase signature domain-containing protein n=1 Tax=Aspergillus cavernicola TaxID=176166 RepID=A0ABR4IIF8_9EURO